MLKAILVGLDGSPFSDRAVDLALRWAKNSDAMVAGLAIIDKPNIMGGESVPIGAGPYKQHADEIRLSRATSQAEQFLERFSLRCSEEGVSSKVLEDLGSPADLILKETQRFDLLLLGQQTNFHFATQDEPCETLPAVLRQTPRPVVAVPRYLGLGESVMIAYDGSMPAARALQAFWNTGLGVGREIHVVSVGNDHLEASRHADRAIDYLSHHGARAERHVPSPGSSIANVLIDKAKELGVGIMVMGSYGKSAIREFFLGSVTRDTLQGSTVPLFLYH